jgi:hypothetical protein
VRIEDRVLSKEKTMKNWRVAVRDGFASGSVASVLSTVALAVCGKIEAGNAYAPTNAVSHWLWGDVAGRQNGFQAKYTIPGYLVHHGSAVFWAVLLEKCYGHKLDKGDTTTILKAAATTTAVACFTDYKLTPHRLQPGYEMRLSKPSLLAVYITFGLGLAIGAKALRDRAQ